MVFVVSYSLKEDAISLCNGGVEGNESNNLVIKELHDTAVHHSSVLTKLLIVIAIFFINKRRTKIKLVPNESFVVVWQVITL